MNYRQAELACRSYRRIRLREILLTLQQLRCCKERKIMTLTSKQRAYLMSLASSLDPIMQVGKNGASPETVTSVEELFNNRELIKITVLKTSPEEPAVIAEAVAGRTRSTLVKVIGRRFILYRPDKDNPKIVLPKA